MRNRMILLATASFFLSLLACSPPSAYHPARMNALAHSAELQAGNAAKVRDNLQSSQSDLSGEVEGMLSDVVDAESTASQGAVKVAPRIITAPKKAKAKKKEG